MREKSGISPSIRIRGAREHNLRDVDVDIPRERMTVVTGVSGSGKSSLAFDVLFREAQRRYLESFSTYARIFLDRLGTPNVEEITGLPPAVAVRQRRGGGGSRSTVGTLSGVYDLLRLLFARIGIPPGDRPDLVVDRNLFSFNSPRGACPVCRGHGVEDRVDPDLLVADPRRSLRQGALVITTPSGYLVYSQVTMDVLDQVCRAHGFDVDTPWRELTDEQRKVVLYGSDRIRIPYGKHPLESRLKWKGITARPRVEGEYRGIVPVIEQILKQKRNRNALRFARTRSCSGCGGSRLGPDARSVLFRGMHIGRMAGMTIGEMHGFMSGLEPGDGETDAFASIRGELVRRLDLLMETGLGYLRVDRDSAGLSGGEYQRIRLAAGISAGLTGVLYVIDEPSAGMHPRDRSRLVEMLARLSRRGNTVVLVEHDAGAVRAADYMIDLGPGPGSSGGGVVAAGEPGQLAAAARKGGYADSLTLSYLLGRRVMKDPPPESGVSALPISLRKVRLHNLRGVDVDFQAAALNVVSGVSGAGKSSLVSGVLAPSVRAAIKGEPLPGSLESLTGIRDFRRVLEVDQSPVGRTPRSNPATYTGMFDMIRGIYARQPLALERGWGKGRFSFNTPGGRCETCQGAGRIQMGMQFMGSVEVECPQCGGLRFNPETRSVLWRGLGIHEILELTVDAALRVFENHERIAGILKTLRTLGLGYLTLGQSSTTLSGGEAQRVKLAAELSRPADGPALYILDEPSSGLHPHDIGMLMKAIFALVSRGHTVVAVEHHPEVIAVAHRVIDLGPEGGESGGRVVFQGSPSQLAQCHDSHTGAAMRGEISGPEEPEEPGPDEWIRFTEVNTHNLKGVDASFPRRRLTAVTGVSGSGKSSLVEDTLLGTGQNRFLQSFPAYARRLLLRHHDAEFAQVSGLCPALAPARAGAAAPNSRSTVGTVSRIQPLLRLLFSRFGKPDGHGLPAEAFSTNRHAGACPECGGLGYRRACDPDRLIAEPNRTVLDGALANHPRLRFFALPDGRHAAVLSAAAREYGKDISRPWQDLDRATRDLICHGAGSRSFHVEWNFRRGNRSGVQYFESTWPGLCGLVEEEYSRVHGDSRGRVLESLMIDRPCPVCGGRALKPESLAVRYQGYTIHDYGEMECGQLADCLGRAGSGPETPLLERILSLLESLRELGVGYLSLNRSTSSLSRGELQRIRLAGILGGTLSGTAIVLDEPARGLHPADTLRLLGQIRRLLDLDNTVVMVEHDLRLIRAADHMIDLGPGGGEYGGRIVARGDPRVVRSARESLTAAWLRGERSMPSRTRRETPENWIHLRAAAVNNLKNIDVALPRERLTVVTGVSGSGKTSFVFQVLEPSAQEKIPVNCQAISGLEDIRAVSALKGGGKMSARTAPAVECGLWERFREKFATTVSAREKGLTKRHFSWLSSAGSCRDCGGAGRVKVNLDFLNDLWVPCGTCRGKRFRPDVLACTWRGISPADVLDMSVDQARERFAAEPELMVPLDRLATAGLGYLKLGQGGHTLSSGEVQRLRLCSDLAREIDSRLQSQRLILLDEPAAGLHPEDARRLLAWIDACVDRGATVVWITHRIEIITAADWVVDMGPGAGDKGGEIVVAGAPRDVSVHPASITGGFMPADWIDPRPGRVLTGHSGRSTLNPRWRNEK